MGSLNVNIEFYIKREYEGYKGINIEKFKIEHLKSLKKIILQSNQDEAFINLNDDFNSLDELSLEEIKKMAKDFCLKYFNLNDIYVADPKELIEKGSYFSTSNSYEEFFDKVNLELRKINPLDIKTVLTDGHSMVGSVEKPYVFAPNSQKTSNRKVYFSKVELGCQLTSLSAGTLVHEIAHTQQEQNIGYASDYLHKEIVSIFLEKVVALECDPTGRLLKLSERKRFEDLKKHYYKLNSKDNNIDELEKINCLLYIKSTLYAIKLFDLYLNERSPEKRDQYFIDIQKVFDGKITVEEMIDKRKINISQCQDVILLKKHI